MNERIQTLKLIAAKISSAATPETQVSLLSEGFELFSLETERLEKTYSLLKEQFTAVNHKLEETNKKLSHKVEELHILTNYLDNILSHMAQGLIFIDVEGHITTYNQAAEFILEKPKPEILYQRYQDHFPDTFFGFSLENTLKTHAVPKTAFTTLSFPDGRTKEIEIESTFVPLRKSTHLPFDFTQGLIILLRDMTELRQLQVIASRNDRMQALGEMAAQVAHEIRNPLGGIKGFAALLQRDLLGQSEPVKLTEYIIEGTNTLDRLINQVLDYSRPMTLSIEKHSLNTLIQELITSLTAEGFINKNIECIFTSPLELDGCIDRGFFQSALRNLLMNGIEAMPGGGKLHISLLKENDKIHIVINDTGVGISEESQRKLFSPFFTTKVKGNGLGLAEAHKVIQALGGEILVKSTPGKGSTFTIKLPWKR